MKIKKELVCALAAVLAVAAVPFAFALHSTGAARHDDVVRVGVLPSAGERELQGRYSPLLARLSQKTGRGSKLVTANSYEELLQLFKERRIDLAYFGGLTFIQASAFFGAEPLVMRDAAERASSYAVVREGGPFQDCFNLKCANLGQARLLFGPTLSTSGHLMPRHFLKVELGAEPETYFSAVRYASGHRATARGVIDGEADMGMVNAQMFRGMLRDGVVKPGELRVVWETSPFPDAVWAVPAEMDEVTKTELRDTFLTLAPADDIGTRVSAPDLFDNYLPAGSADFASLMDIAKSQGLMTRGLMTRGLTTQDLMKRESQ